MTKQQNKIKPYKTTPYREGCHSQKEYVLPFKDVVGNTALITYCDFINKKGVLVKGHVLFVKWVEEWEYRMKKHPAKSFEDMLKVVYPESLDKEIAQGFNERQKDREESQHKQSGFVEDNYG